MYPKLQNISSFQEQQRLISLLEELGWWDMQPMHKRREILANAPINSFILTKEEGLEEIILSFIDRERLFKEQVIYILENDPRWCFKNGSNHVYHFLPELIADVLSCEIEEIKPINRNRDFS